jgi:hypothetical protein
MPTFSAPDGTHLAYHMFGEGIPVICLPGGPMQDSVYLGDLGGMSAYRQLIMVDHRGSRGRLRPAGHPRDTGRIQRAGAAACRRGRPEHDPERRGRISPSCSPTPSSSFNQKQAIFRGSMTLTGSWRQPRRSLG